MEIQDDAQKAYEQCLNYLQGSQPKKIVPRVEIEVVTRKKRKKKYKRVLCPACKKEMDARQAQCPNCMKIREVSRKYFSDKLAATGAINANPNIPKTILRKKVTTKLNSGLNG